MARSTTSAAPRGLVCLLLGCVAALAQAAEPIPINAWIHDPLIDSVDITPNGEQLVALTLPDINAPPEVTVWQTRNLALPPRRFKPVDVKAIGVFWLNDEYLLVVGRQKFDIRTGARPTKWFRNKVYVVDDEGKRFRELLENKEAISVQLTNVLPQHKDRFQVALTDREFATDLYEVNLGSFLAKRIYRGTSGEGGTVTDLHGDIRSRQTLEGSGKQVHIRYSYKHPQTGAWEEHHRLYATEREGMQPVGFDNDGRRVYMLDNTGRDKSVLRTYDLITRELGEPLYGDDDIDALDVIQATNPGEFGKVVGFLGARDKVLRQYIEPKRLAMQQRLEETLPAGQEHIWVAMSDDLTVIVVRSTGPREAGAYHLLVNGRELVPLGRSFPLLHPDQMADMAFVSYKARDGLEIPGFLTTPGHGEPPYPAVVLPHGGPWARDYLRWDRWAQFLANRGYLVLQPQYRGSDGWGQALWRAGDNEWGQKMQDDKDDGARWLVEQELAHPDRIAIFGYSYGGFAAMAASVRPNSPYQCAIAGAGLAELRSFDKVTFTNPFQREYQNPTIGGMSPLDHIKEAGIPIFVFHGDRDQRVPVEQSRKFVRALRRAGKDVKYLEVVDLWHSLPWWPQHHLAMFESLENYLANDCGPGGL